MPDNETTTTAMLVSVFVRYGYTVVVRPKGDDLPPFARGYPITLRATRDPMYYGPGRANVLVTVVNHAALLDGTQKVTDLWLLSSMATKYGWAYDVAVVGYPDKPAQPNPALASILPNPSYN